MFPEKTEGNLCISMELKYKFNINCFYLGVHTILLFVGDNLCVSLCTVTCFSLFTLFCFHPIHFLKFLVKSQPQRSYKKGYIQRSGFNTLSEQKIYLLQDQYVYLRT